MHTCAGRAGIEGTILVLARIPAKECCTRLQVSFLDFLGAIAGAVFPGFPLSRHGYWEIKNCSLSTALQALSFLRQDPIGVDFCRFTVKLDGCRCWMYPGHHQFFGCTTGRDLWKPSFISGFLCSKRSADTARQRHRMRCYSRTYMLILLKKMNRSC